MRSGRLKKRGAWVIRELDGKTYVLSSSTVVAGNRLAEGASDAMCPRCRGSLDVKGCRRWMYGRFHDDDGVKKRDEMSNTINK